MISFMLSVAAGAAAIRTAPRTGSPEILRARFRYNYRACAVLLKSKTIEVYDAQSTNELLDPYAASRRRPGEPSGDGIVIDLGDGRAISVWEEEEEPGADRYRPDYVPPRRFEFMPPSGGYKMVQGLIEPINRRVRLAIREHPSLSVRFYTPDLERTNPLRRRHVGGVKDLLFPKVAITIRLEDGRELFVERTAHPEDEDLELLVYQFSVADAKR